MHDQLHQSTDRLLVPFPLGGSWDLVSTVISTLTRVIRNDKFHEPLSRHSSAKLLSAPAAGKTAGLCTMEKVTQGLGFRV